MALPCGFVDGTRWILVSSQGIFLIFHHSSICPQLFLEKKNLKGRLPPAKMA
jgi:hypothetical protein